MDIYGVGSATRIGKFPTEVQAEEKTLPTCAPGSTSALDDLARLEQGQDPTSAKQNQRPTLLALSNDMLHTLVDFLADDPHALSRLAATCKKLQWTLGPFARRFTWRDRSRKANSLERYRALLDYAATERELRTPSGKLPPFRADLLETLGRRILALPPENRKEALEAFVVAAEQHNEPQTASLKNVLDDAKKGVPHLESVERRAVERVLPECRGCADLNAVRTLAAQHGICSPEGLAEMKFAAACGKVSGSSELGWTQARDLFEIPDCPEQRQREYEYDVARNWRVRFYE